MASKKTDYDVICDAIKEKVKKNGSSSYSKSDLVELTRALINTPEKELSIFVKNSKSDEPTIITSKPVEKYRESLKPVLKQFGIDKAELDKIQDIQFTKDHAESLAELSQVIVKDYTGAGRKLKFPITSASEGEMSITQVNVKEKTADTRKIVKGDDGLYSSELTGKRVTTKEHNAMKASNKIPGWLKFEQK